MKRDIPETAIHTSYLPWLAKGRCADRQAGTLGPRQAHEFYCSVAGGPQPARGGRRCQVPLDATLATLADALEAIGVNGRRPGGARCRRRRFREKQKKGKKADTGGLFALTRQGHSDPRGEADRRGRQLRRRG
jgi:hypothetical protein